MSSNSGAFVVTTKLRPYWRLITSLALVCLATLFLIAAAKTFTLTATLLTGSRSHLQFLFYIFLIAGLVECAGRVASITTKFISSASQ
jgi:hypothetical protein